MVQFQQKSYKSLICSLHKVEKNCTGQRQATYRHANYAQFFSIAHFIKCVWMYICSVCFLQHKCTSINFHNIESVIPRLKSKKNYEPKGSSLWAPGSGFSIRIRVGGKTSRVGDEGTTRAEGMILGWGCMGASPTWMILKIRTS